MSAGIITFGSNLHDQQLLEASKKNFADCLNCFVEARLITSDEFMEVDFIIVFILTGGCEQKFVETWPLLKASGRKFILAAGETSNSLPAALEILAWLRQQNEEPEIIHGKIEAMADKAAYAIKTSFLKESLKRQRIGVIGAPSDWLIASMPQFADIEKLFGIEIESISIENFRRECEKPDTSSLAEFSEAFYKYSGKDMTSELARAARIYTGLTRCVRKLNLNALTIRCFDILETDRTTGCLAVALLNDRGIPVSCEGDVPALLTMMIINRVTGNPSFMANPSSVKGNSVVFAHCTCPVSMLDNVCIPTHFESGIGLAISGKFKENDFTVFKVSPDQSLFSIQSGPIETHEFSQHLCRTQIALSLAGAESYFLNRALGNHHIIAAGNHKKALTDFCGAFGFKNIW